MRGVTKKRVILGSIIVAMLGGAFVFAAVNVFSSTESEAATRSGNVSIVSDATASGTSAIKFGQAPASSCDVPDRVTVTSANQSSYPAYPVNTKLYVPSGPDPWGGCFPGPSNTGVPAGTQLTNYTGPCTITTANTVIDKKTVNCVLDIRAQNVQITNSLINGRVYVDDTRCASISSTDGSITNPGTASFTITDSTVVTNEILNRALTYCNYTATRVNLSGGGSTAICINCTIQDSYLHDPQEDPDGHAHNSTVRMGAKGNLIHNTLWCNVRDIASTDGSGDVSGCSANQTAYSHDATVAYYDTMRRNFYAAIPDGYCGYGGSTGGAGAGKVSNMKFIENIFQRGSNGNNWNPTAYICGYYGPITSLDLDLPGNEFTNNTWDNGKPLSTTQNTWYTNPGNSTAGPCYGAPANCTW